MNFLYPGFLFALLTIAIPIVIHLFNFRKFKKVYFSNVQFLKEAKEQNSSRENLKHLLVLFSRILAILFLVLAFARPFIPLGKSANPSQKNAISIYLDNSYSMEAVNKEGSLLDEAKRKAKEIVESYNLNDQFQLITNDFEGKHQRFTNKDEFIQQLEEVKISSTSRSLQQVMNRQRSAANNVNNVSYLLSDFQKNFVGSQSIKVDSSNLTTFVKLNANSLPNISADSIWSLSPVHQPNHNEQIVVRIKNFGDEDAKDIPIKLTINGGQKAISNVIVPAGKSITDTLSFSGLKTGWQKGVLSIKDYPLTFDDELNFSFKVSPDMKVLHISGDLDQTYIKSLFSTDSYFKLTEMPEGNVKYSTFAGFSLIVVTGLKEPSSGLAQQLKAYVQNGGSLILFPDLNVSTAIYNPFLNALALPSVDQLNIGTPVASTLDLKNALFKDVFDQAPKNLDLPSVTRYFSYVSKNALSREDVLQLPLNKFLIAGYNVGAGKIYLSATSLDLKDGNLARHPVFVPLMFKIAFGSSRSFPLYYTTGSSEVLESQKITLLKNQSLKLVSEQFEAIPDVRQTPASTFLYVADQIKKSGFYNLVKGDSTLAVMAFNDNRMESDMHYANNSDLAGLLGKQKVNIINSRKDAQSLQVDAKSNSIELWKLCIILALIFLALEILLIKFFNNTKNLKTA